MLAGDGTFCAEAGDLLAGLRIIDQILAGRSAEPGELLGAIDRAAALLCPAD